MNYEQKELILELISRYCGIGDYVKLDIEGDLRNDEHPSKILARFINGCFAAKYVGIEPLTIDPEYCQIVTAIIEAGASPNIADGKYPPIVAAAEKGEFETVEFLINKGVNLNGKAEYPDRAIHFAAYNGHVDIICLLIKNGVNINAKGGDHNTALHYAVEGAHREVVEFLLLHGADPKAKNSVRVTAYQKAKAKNDTEIISLFQPFV